MILIICGACGSGKTALMTHLLNQYAYDISRTRAMEISIEELNANGFNLEIPQNCVSANYPIEFFKFRRLTMTNRLINPFCLGYKNPMVETVLDYPFGVYGIQEGQKYFNSRKSANYPSWQSRWFEQHRHNNLDIIIDVQRAGLIDLNLRELAQFIEIENMQVKYSLYGRITGVVWTVKRFGNNFIYDIYNNSGKKATDTYERETIEIDYNVFNCYNTQNCQSIFYNGREKESFNISADFNDDMPKYFYTSEEKYYELLERQKKEKKYA